MHNHPTPKFSVITVTYNAEAVLEDTIQSVISQTYRHVEYIIVDGASKDKTLSIIDRYKDHIAKVTSEPDKGLYDAMNKGIRLATGDYLCFLNAGDSFHEDDTLQQMVHTLPGSELPDVMYGETALVDKEGLFFTPTPHGGFIFLFLAFLLSPYGLQAVAGLLIEAVDGLGSSLRQFLVS